MIDWSAIPRPDFLQGDRRVAYRDPAGHYHNGVFRVFHSRVNRETPDRYDWRVAVTESRNLVDWTEPRVITPPGSADEYASPGNVIRYNGNWLLCLQVYSLNHEPSGRSPRIATMASDDLIHWRSPEIMLVRGPDVPVAEMERMIDAYLFQDKDDDRKWWCFYKDKGHPDRPGIAPDGRTRPLRGVVGMAYTYDLRTWRYHGFFQAWENVCVLVDGGEYVLLHSPRNGIGVKRSQDLAHWQPGGVWTLGQADWPWAQGRLSAPHVLDLRDRPEVGKYVMFFHGSTRTGVAENEPHGESSLGLAWSDDLTHWSWPP
jgi:hypothetical protein